ncbi:DUF397 domain-containing protein [Streptomyces sp. NPDC051985]
MDTRRKSSYSGEGDGNECVEIATTPTFPTPAFTPFLEALKSTDHH